MNELWPVALVFTTWIAVYAAVGVWQNTQTLKAILKILNEHEKVIFRRKQNEGTTDPGNG